MVRLGELQQRLGGELVRPPGSTRAAISDVVVADVTLDSRESTAGALFAALPGLATDGGRFAESALAAGAVAVLSGTRLDLPAPLWLHPEPRRAAGLAAALAHAEPAQKLFTVAVTGTNGKTSVCHLAAQLLEALGRSPAVLGTVGHRLAGATAVASQHTTPDAPTLHRLLARHLTGGGDSALLEASSHGLDQDRLAGVEPRVAVYTGLSRDHLDYHADLDAYAAAKRKLFEGMAPGGLALVLDRDPHSDAMAAAARERGARVLRYGGESADVALLGRVSLARGQRLRVRLYDLGELELELPLVGQHNAENLLAALTVAAAAARAAGQELLPEELVDAVRGLAPAPGRLERVRLATDARARDEDDELDDATEPSELPGLPAVWVDYAHTPDALERVLGALREGLERRGRGGALWVVFGCGGDRDRGKRGAMGEVAARDADRVVVTSDNPRSEDPAEIAAQILTGARAALPSGAPEPLLELDRSAAIRLALSSAGPEDTVLLAGKGHEAYQAIGAERLAFDDREVAREALRELAEGVRP